MTGDSKFFLSVGVVVVAIVSAVFLFSGSNKESISFSDIDTTVGHKKGPDTAKVKIVEFADYVCPACSTVPPIISEVLTNNPGTVQLVFRHFPLPGNRNAIPAAQAAEAAALQNKFWEMSDLIFSKQEEWKSVNDPFAIFMGYASQLKLDSERFKSDYYSDAVSSIIDRDKEYADRLGVDQTPFFVINGKPYPGNRPVNEWQKLIDELLANAS